MKGSVVPDKQNEESFESEVPLKKYINAPEDLDAWANSHPEVNDNIDVVETADSGGREDPDKYSSFLPEVPEYNEVLGTRSRNEGKTEKTSDYDTKKCLYASNIDKSYQNTWRTIYKATDERYLIEVKWFPRAFINLCKKHPNVAQKVPTDIKKNSKTIALEESWYAQVVRILRKIMVQRKDTRKT